MEKLQNKEDSDNCIFCEIAGRREEGLIIARTPRALALVSLEGHPVVFPIKHVDEKNLQDSREDMAAVYELANLLDPIVRKVFDVDAVNFLENRGEDAGQEVPHYHLHIFPRQKGDNYLKLREMNQIPHEDRRKILQDFQKFIE